MAQPSSKIPIVDFSPFLNSHPIPSPIAYPTSQLRTATEIVNGFKLNGFVYLKNIPLSSELVSQAFRWSKLFFDLPVHLKQQALHPPDGACHRGYSPIGLEKVVQSGLPEANDKPVPPDHKETFDIGKPDQPPHNIWLPDQLERSLGLSGIREFFAGFYEACQTFELQILRAISIGIMGYERADHLGQFHRQSNNQIRLVHYPPIDRREISEGARERFGAHTDFGTITILFQDAVGGLEVESPAERGQFLGVTPIEGTVVVNVGDLLMRWSNDSLRSTLHRVGPPAGTGLLHARYSIPYFCSPDPEALIDCLPGSPVPPKYQPIRAHEYLSMRMKASY